MPFKKGQKHMLKTKVRGSVHLFFYPTMWFLCYEFHAHQTPPAKENKTSAFFLQIQILSFIPSISPPCCQTTCQSFQHDLLAVPIQNLSRKAHDVPAESAVSCCWSSCCFQHWPPHRCTTETWVFGWNKWTLICPSRGNLSKDGAVFDS